MSYCPDTDRSISVYSEDKVRRNQVMHMSPSNIASQTITMSEQDRDNEQWDERKDDFKDVHIE